MATFRCPAKVNLALSVGGPRAGDGYHPLCSWMVQVTLFDDLVVERLGDGATSSFTVDWAGDAPQKSPIDWPIEKDLICKAHRALEEHAGRPLPVKVTLRKRIPVGAGLAGGSTDGAAMLKAIDQLFGLNVPRPAMTSIAGKLGSDVPFFLYHHSAVVSGVGEIVEPAPARSTLHLTLIFPPLHCNTGAVYRKFDELSRQNVADESAVRRLLPLDPLPPDAAFNDLAEPAMHVEPRLREMRADLMKRLNRAVHITGSGAAMFIVAEHLEDARRLEATIRAAGMPAMAVQTLG